MTLPGSAAVVPLGPAESDRAGALIARAFDTDPLAAHLFPDQGDRGRLAPLLFGAFLRYDRLFGHVDRLGDFRAVAAWQLPDGPGETPERLARAGFADLPRAVPLVRLEAVLEAIGAAVARAAPGPHWHLRLLAVDPDAQGSGLGAALLGYGLRRADASGRAGHPRDIFGAGRPLLPRPRLRGARRRRRARQRPRLLGAPPHRTALRGRMERGARPPVAASPGLAAAHGSRAGHGGRAGAARLTGPRDRARASRKPRACRRCRRGTDEQPAGAVSAPAPSG